jgi:ferredoxin/flavodoxin---NADP+ reductase
MLPTTPLTVAIIGTGPSGFYAAEHLLKRHPGVQIDLFDRLPTPYGLVRGGVAPDHQKIKSVTRIYEKIAANPAVRFFGHVTFGTDLSREDLLRHYHAVIYAVGAPTDRSLGIPGESLAGSHPATDFVGWYNGHPDYRDQQFDLTSPGVVVIGMGNVAVDVVRILARTPEELRTTDIAEHALEALCRSKVRDIYMIGRRGPVQGAFTNPELKELGEMAGADIDVRAADLELDAGSAAVLASTDDKTVEKNLNTLRHFAQLKPSGKARTIHLRFLLSPVELQGHSRVEQVVLGHNQLVAGNGGDLKAVAAGTTETLASSLVFRSVGYHGVALRGVAFDSKRGVIPNQAGRVLREPGQPAVGEYVVGWIKRGPSGVIGTNKPDAVESTDALLADYGAGALVDPEVTSREAIPALLAQRKVRVISWQDWLRLDAQEKSRGEAIGRPRLKYTRIDEMLAVVGR